MCQKNTRQHDGGKEREEVTQGQRKNGFALIAETFFLSFVLKHQVVPSRKHLQQCLGDLQVVQHLRLSTSSCCQSQKGVNGQELPGFSGGRNQLLAQEFHTDGCEDSCKLD